MRVRVRVRVRPWYRVLHLRLLLNYVLIQESNPIRTPQFSDHSSNKGGLDDVPEGRHSSPDGEGIKVRESAARGDY